MFKPGIILWIVSVAYGGPVLVNLTGKQLLKGKVMGSGFSLPAKSLLQCMDACNEHAPTCDGIVYHENIGKCRMINKCAVAIHVDNSSAAVYFSKRPLIKADGYLHIPETDTCMGLQSGATDYADGDRGCAKADAELAVIQNQRANKAASNLLRRAELSWAWISNLSSNIGNISASPGHFTPEIVDSTNLTSRGCWAINYSGQWRQFPCKNHKLPSLCQVQPFPA